MRAKFVAMLVMLLAWWIALSPAMAQPALERLERQIRDRTQSPDAPSLESQPGGESSQPGYLGLVADDQKDRGRGVRILDVQRGSPAEAAGLRTQDLITALAGVRVRQMTDMSDVLSMYGPGQVIDFDVMRDGKPKKLHVVLGQRAAVAVHRQPNQPETVPLPPAEAIAEPQEPELQAADATRIEQLERRVSELERRVAELEAAAKTRNEK
jgi:C-terminal processing protease CtpA/Prc